MTFLKLIFGLLSALVFSSIFIISLLGRDAFPEGNLIDIIKVILG